MEDDRSFYERRLHEELARAVIAGDEGLKSLHRRWAMLYKHRLAKLGRRDQPPPAAIAGRNGSRQRTRA